MKKVPHILFVLILLFFVPSKGMSGDLIKEADAIFETGGLDNYKKSLDLYLNAVKAFPDSFEANWKIARACRYYSYEHFKLQIEGWEEISKKYSKIGMGYAQKAMELESNKPDGYYYYAVCVASYADAVSILTALTEGLKAKTQSSFEKVYQMDKTYDDGGAMLSLGRFWYVLPWPLRDKDLSLKYFEEYKATSYFGKKEEGLLFISELYIDLDKDKYKNEVKKLLEPLLTSDKKYFQNKSKEIMDGLN